MLNFNLISLGCAKNLVDSEVMLGSMMENGWTHVESPDDADLLLLNTCGFIQSAVEEAIEEILQLGLIKERFPDKKIVVTGCLVQRYKEKLGEDLPEVDLFIGTEGVADIAGLIMPLFQGEVETRVILPQRFLMDSSLPRIVSTPHSRAWLKITEGCSNRCAYCMIPSIRGGLRSRDIDDLVRESVGLEEQGVKELSLIAQDSTAYGNDLDSGTNIVSLLEGLLARTAIPWIRLLYLYPSGITDHLLQLMADNSRIVPYLDIPFQHVNDRVLRKMNRRYSSDDLYSLVPRIRDYLPEIALRTTFLVGFPGETEEEFLEIETFLRRNQIDHVGVFAYANEEGCPSEEFEGQLPEDEKRKRCDHLLELQVDFSREIQKKYIGRVEPVLVEGFSRETDLLLEGTPGILCR